MAGLILDDWQQAHLIAGLGETADGLWAALEVAEVVARQNGKNGELEARQLGGLFLLEELLQIHSAHMADTSVEQFVRLEALIEGTPEFSRRVKKMARGKGNEEILLRRHPKTGRAPRLRFRPRTGSGGRGFSCDCLYGDEAMRFPEAFHGVLMPTLSARPNPQIWYMASAVDEDDPAHDGVVLARLRERALRGDDPSLVYAEYSADIGDPEKDDPGKVTDEIALDPERWAEANPALGIRISEDYIGREQRSMSARAFAVERLGVGKWPRTDGLDAMVITPEQWGKCLDRDQGITGGMCFALDVDPVRSNASVCVAGLRGDELVQVELMEHKRGTGWVVEYVVERVERHKPSALLLDGMSGAFALLPDLTEALRAKGLLSGLHEGEVTVLGAREHGQACGMFYDAVEQQTLRHRGQPEIAEALRGAAKSNLTDAWRWSRKDSSVNITSLVAVTLAHWGLQTLSSPKGGVVDVTTIWQEMTEREGGDA